MTKATKTNSAKPYRVLISRSALLDLVLEQDEGIARLFEVLQQNPKPFIPFLSDRALGDFQRLLELEEGVDAAALVRSFYDHFQILKVTMFHVRTANRLNWPDLERAIDYAVAMEQRLDAVVFLDPMEAKGTQELVMTVTPEGLLKRLELEGLWQEMEAEAEGSERDFLAQLLLLLVTGVLPEVSDQVEPAPRPTAIGEADQPVKANDQATDLQRSQESSGGVAEPRYHEGIQLTIKLGDKECPLRVYGPSLDAMVRAKKLERDALNAELDQLQQQLDQLTQAVGDFDSQFKRRVGVLYVELLNLKALYWRERWGFDPSLEMILKEFYQEARQRQREIYGNAYDADDSMWTDWESFKAGKGSSESHPPSNWEEELKRRNDPQLKEIRRRIAKQISPDYVMATADPELIQRYTELMQRVNTAVEAGDLVTLERIEAQLFGFLDEDVSPSLRMQLQRLLKEIATLREHIIQVEQEIKQQQLSDSYQLLQNLQQCGESVEAFLSRQAENVTAEIEIVNEQIKQFRKQKNAKAQGETP